MRPLAASPDYHAIAPPVFLCRMEIKCGAPISILLKLYHSGVQFSIFFMLLHAKIFPAALQDTKEWCKLKI
jgi:hypothetical protein